MENYSKCLLNEIRYLMETNHKCVWIEHPTKKKELGSGEDALIFQICCSKDESLNCEYVVKVQNNNRNRFFEKEVDMHLLFSKLGIGIPIIDAFMCDSHGSFLMMEKRDFTPEQYVKYLLENGKSQEFILQQIENIKKEALRIVKIGFENGLNHNDLHINNIMLNLGPDDTFKDLSLIDFGKSKKELLKPSQIEDELQDFSLSFDRVKKILKEKKKTKSPPQVKKRKEKKVPVSTSRLIFDEEEEKSFSTPKKKKGLVFEDEDSFSTPIKGSLSYD